MQVQNLPYLKQEPSCQGNTSQLKSIIQSYHPSGYSGLSTLRRGAGVGVGVGGGAGLTSAFTHSGLLPSASCIQWCIQVSEGVVHLVRLTLIQSSFGSVLICACQFWGDKSLTEFRHCFKQKGIAQTITRTPSRPVSCPTHQCLPEKCKPPFFYIFGVTLSGIERQPPAARAHTLTARLWRCSFQYIVSCLSTDML